MQHIVRSASQIHDPEGDRSSGGMHPVLPHSPPAPNYFTCTLGQAQRQNLTNKSFRNIPSFTKDNADRTPSQPAVGFAVPPPSGSEEAWSHILFTFGDLYRGSTSLAAGIKKAYGSDLDKNKTVALLCPSTPTFLFTWLALMHLGKAVLLIAPQCQPPAIAHLLKECKANCLFYDEQYATQAQEAVEAVGQHEKGFMAVQMPVQRDAQIADLLQKGTSQLQDPPDLQITDIAYLHHTSGTSSGLPKPIPQSHRAGAGVLPRFKDGHTTASFTTTPLYHGGVADCFRAWSSGALIWLFPGKGIPITAKNIIACLDIAETEAKTGQTPPVKYFSSVPYVLQSMEADERGLSFLQSMAIVGVGGAALPAEVGDRLVRSGVNLISRFGSAECGFLMSSHRNYDTDKEWQYLRSDLGSENLRFEPQDDSLVELVITDGWPHMAKRNRDDKSFATADLFAPHESISDAWRYHSRADSQLTLITGKKFDPAPLEDAIATSDMLEDVLIFGNGQPYPGALLFRSTKAQQMSDNDLLTGLWTAIEKINKDSQGHARLLRKMLVPMPKLDTPLEKSSKGTILRSAVEKRFSKDIERAYVDADDTSLGSVADDDVADALREHIMFVTGRKDHLDDDADLFDYGVDSVAGMQIRNSIRQMVPKLKKPLPLNIVEDCGSLERLVDFVLKSRHGEAVARVDEEEKELMLELANKYSKFDGRSDADIDVVDADGDQRDVVVLTGATGALGAHILDLYTKDHASVRHVYCLVRGADAQACRERVSKALEYRKLGQLDDSRITILQAQLSQDRLGLKDDVYRKLTSETTVVMHVAWSVNFRTRLRSFEKDNIAGLTNLINLTLRSTRPNLPRFGFCSSVASCLAFESSLIPEKILPDPSSATTLGYSRSKWVAEAICASAAEQYGSCSTGLQDGGRGGLDITVFRVGQLGGDSRTGIWNASEAWPMMLSAGIEVTGTLPDLGPSETLDWLPVDVAALALTQGMMKDEQRKKHESSENSDATAGIADSDTYAATSGTPHVASSRSTKSTKEREHLESSAGSTTLHEDGQDKRPDAWPRSNDTRRVDMVEGAGAVSAIDAGLTHAGQQPSPSAESDLAQQERHNPWDQQQEKQHQLSIDCNLHVMHVVHDGVNPNWSQMLGWLQKYQEGKQQQKDEKDGGDGRGVLSSSESPASCPAGRVGTRAVPRTAAKEAIHNVKSDQSAGAVCSAMEKDGRGVAGNKVQEQQVVEAELSERKRRKFDVVSPSVWVRQLEAEAESARRLTRSGKRHSDKDATRAGAEESIKSATSAEHPAFKLLDLWKSSYAHVADDDSDSTSSSPPAAAQQRHDKDASSSPAAETDTAVASGGVAAVSDGDSSDSTSTTAPTARNHAPTPSRTTTRPSAEPDSTWTTSPSSSTSSSTSGHPPPPSTSSPSTDPSTARDIYDQANHHASCSDRGIHHGTAGKTDDDLDFKHDNGARSSNNSSTKDKKTFATKATKARIPILRNLAPVDETYVLRIWAWILSEANVASSSQ